MKILAFGASNSQNSINRKLALHVAHLLVDKLKDAEVDALDLNDFEMPLFGVDREAKSGQPIQAQQFLDRIAAADAIVVSMAEHNGSYSVAFKNVFDWASRINGKVFQNKPMLLLATSPGGRGGASVLEAAKSRFPYMGGRVVGSYALPDFETNFSDDGGVINPGLRAELEKLITEFSRSLTHA